MLQDRCLFHGCEQRHGRTLDGDNKKAELCWKFWARAISENSFLRKLRRKKSFEAALPSEGRYAKFGVGKDLGKYTPEVLNGGGELRVETGLRCPGGNMDDETAELLAIWDALDDQSRESLMAVARGLGGRTLGPS